MKILVLGASGMAGHTITTYFLESNFDVVGLVRKKIDFCDYIIGDVTDYYNLKKVIISGSYDIIINCVGILNKSAEDDIYSALRLNSVLPFCIKEFITGTKTKLIHMSTDCVFKGNTGPYNESSVPDGLTIYDKTKALGEIKDDKNLTFRNSIIGPDMNPDGIGLFNWFMKQKGPIKGYTGAIWTGVTTITLAKAMHAAIRQDLSGLYNLVNNHAISKFDLLGLFNKYFKGGQIEITKFDDFKLDKTLVNTRGDFSFKVPSYELMVSEMKEWIMDHKSYYSHYDIIG